MQLDQLKQVVEVLIFSSDIPLPADQIRQLVEETDLDTIAKAVDELNQEYRNTGRTFQITHVAGGYQLVTHENYAAWVRKLFQGRLKTKLSQAGLETLSVIAFKQPVSKPEIEAIRGVNCDGVLHTLLERKLITISGREDGPGRPLLFKTTREFLRYFGVNEISDLPRPKEIDELFKENAVQQNLLADLESPPNAPPESAAPGGAAPESVAEGAAEGSEPERENGDATASGGEPGGPSAVTGDAAPDEPGSGEPEIEGTLEPPPADPASVEASGAADAAE
jgi:segregation and condensation protein B